MTKVFKITESMSKNRKILGLVSMMSPVELMKALVSNFELLPKEAAQVVYGLKKNSEGLSGGSIETNKMYPVPPSMKGSNDEDEFSLDEYSLRAGPDDDGRGKFPPDPRPSPDSFPYDPVFVNYMNNPKRKRPITSGKENDGEGNGIYQRNFHSPDGDMPGQGSSWSVHGRKGWSSAPGEFEIPPKSIKKADPVEFSQPLAGGQANHPPNAGDTEDGTVFMNDPNVGQTIWVPGRQGARSAPFRTYRKR